MTQGDFKRSYDAGKAAYREKRASWLVPSVVIVVLTVEINRRHGVSWSQTLIAAGPSLIALVAWISIVGTFKGLIVPRVIEHDPSCN